ncbi:MAG: hypothetical protein Q8P50_18805 [Bacillota bacterium]|nr:hypothetical protein [Bacillota bacterium]
MRVDSLVPTSTKIVEKQYDWTVSKTVVDPEEIAAQSSHEYSYGPVAFTPVSGANSYCMVAYVTLVVHGGTGTGQEITHRESLTLPSVATSIIETDATASLSDMLGAAPVGSEFGYDGSHGPWLLTGSGTFTYKAATKNVALSASANFPNTITLVEDNSGQTRTSRATVLVGLSTAGLSAYDPASIAIVRPVSYSWGLDKYIVGPSTVTIPLGQTKDIDYAFIISRTPVYTETTGRMTSAGVPVTNSGSDPVTVSKVTVQGPVQVSGRHWGRSDVIPVAKWEVTPGNLIASGAPHLYGPYEINFTPVTGADYRTHVEATTTR